MLTEIDKLQNKNRYVSLIDSIDVASELKDEFKNWLLEESDFFDAPASTRYHGAYEGGLCEHSLHVYDVLHTLVQQFATHTEENPNWGKMKDDETPEPQFISVPNYSDDEIKIVALLHDISKANFYELFMRNVKNDITGKWDKVEDFRIKDARDRFIYGNHEQNSEFIARTFFPLSVEQSTAILHHHGGMGYDSTQVDLTPIYNKYSLAVLLHVADMIACYIMEKIA